MYEIIIIDGVKQLANISGKAPIRESQHDEINELLAHGTVSELAVAQYMAMATEHDFRTNLSLPKILGHIHQH